MSSQSIASLDWKGFLNRAPMVRDRAEAAAMLKGKRVLITGAGGSIGSALAMTVAEFEPRQLILLEASERNLYEVETALRQLPIAPELTPMLGSAGESTLLEEVFQSFRPQIIFHAAAFKHVPILEENPFAAIQNNSIATALLHRAALKHGAEVFVLLSTDKAVDPVSILGASKRVAELVLQRPHHGKLQTRSLRLGNVLGSEGSIVPLFLQQIAAGAPVTVTHSDIRRYFLTLTDAVTLLLHAASISTGQGILVPDLGRPLTVLALARHLLASKSGDQSSIVFTEPRPGDKMCEALLSARESYRWPDDGRLLRFIESPGPVIARVDQALIELQAACNERSLERLLAAVQELVPEYRPSALLEARRQTYTETA